MCELIIRLDAGENIGFGHAVRSIDLAKNLRNNYGIDSRFYSNPNTRLEKMFSDNGFEFCINEGLPESEFLNKISYANPGSILFIDKLFPYTSEEIIKLKSRVKVIMFHNVCEGMYECDSVIFPSANVDEKIIGRIRDNSSDTTFFYGPDYVLINDEVVRSAGYLKKKEDTMNTHIAVTTGASDPKGMLNRILYWFNKSDISQKVIGLYGFDFKHSTKLEELIPRLKPSISVKKFNYKDLFSSQIVVSAFGVTTYEVIYAEIPVITIGHIKRNSNGGEILKKRFACCKHLGLFDTLTKNKFIGSVNYLLSNKDAYQKIKYNQTNLIDGKGMSRITDIIKTLVQN